VACLVLTVLNNIEISFFHRCLEAVLLIARMGNLKTGVVALVQIKKGKNDEGVPDVVGCEERAELPSTSTDIAILFL
jgi:hypothetical protein